MPRHGARLLPPKAGPRRTGTTSTTGGTGLRVPTSPLHPGIGTLCHVHVAMLSASGWPVQCLVLSAKLDWEVCVSRNLLLVADLAASEPSDAGLRRGHTRSLL